MKKCIIYRILGAAALCWEIPNQLIKWINHAYNFSKGDILHFLTGLTVNFFIWAGMIFLWRADVNERSNKSSPWLKVIIFYLVLTLAVVAWKAYVLSKATWD